MPRGQFRARQKDSAQAFRLSATSDSSAETEIRSRRYLPRTCAGEESGTTERRTQDRGLVH